jgi:predicted regulator of Ras-like GTPase activity (Roadblock/LC7/MglB family)
MTAGSPPGDLNWLLEHLVTTVDRVRQAIILASDGLTLAVSPGLSQEDADRLAALAAGLQSLGRGAGQRFSSGEVRQTIIEMDTALLFITAAGRGTCLAVLADAEADAGLVACEMAVLVNRLGQHLATGLRSAEHTTSLGEPRPCAQPPRRPWSWPDAEDLRIRVWLSRRIREAIPEEQPTGFRRSYLTTLTGTVSTTDTTRGARTASKAKPGAPRART